MSETNTQNGSHNTEKQFEAGEKIQEEQIEQPEFVTAKPQTFGSKVKRHCARFWWLHLISFCLCFLIIALCLVYVAMPRIAQTAINESQITITDVEFRSPTADSLVITQKAVLTNPSIYTPTLDPFNASLYLLTNGQFGASPMLDIPMPRIHAQHPQMTIGIENTFCKIRNLDQVTDFAVAALTLETVTTALTGRTDLHLGKLPSTWVTYNTTFTQKGLNGLKGFNVTGARLNATAASGTPNLHGFAYIPNPSAMTIEMGNVTFTVSTASQGQIGTSIINDMTVVPGDNSLPMSSILNQTQILASLNGTGFIDLEIVGSSAVYNGVHLTYYEKALAENKLSLVMNVYQIIADST